MRLYLSSFRLGRRPQYLFDLVRGEKRAAIVLNACDHLAKEERGIKLQQEKTALEGLHISSDELDLRDYFHDPQRIVNLRRQLSKTDLIWVRGGNTFILRRAFRASGFDEILKEILFRDALVYGGFSAGAVVLTPTLHGIELIDDPESIPEGYETPILWEGMGILPYEFAPHYQSDHPESPAVEKLVQYYVDKGIAFKALRDGEVLFIDGAKEEIIS